jgi:S1-C subfamily serine protease
MMGIARGSVIALLAIILISSASAQPAPAGDPALSDLYAQVSPAIGSVLVEGRLKGTAFAAEGGVCITNAHVVIDWQGAIQVLMEDQAIPCRLVTANTATDVAVLLPDRPPQVTLGLADELPAPGEAVWTVGYDAGTLTGLAPGVVAGPPVYQSTDDPPAHGAYRECIRTKVLLGPGSSGSPLLDGRGRVAGLHWGVKSGAGLAMSVPAATISTTLEYALAGIESGDPLPLPPEPHPYLGAMVRETWESLPSARSQQVAAALKEETGQFPEGVFVSTVLSHGPAARAGLHIWDLIQTIDGQPIAAAIDYASAVDGLEVSDPVEVSLLRVVDGDVVPLERTLSVGDANRDVFLRMGEIHAEVRGGTGDFEQTAVVDSDGEALLRVSIGNASPSDISGFRLAVDLPGAVDIVPGSAVLVLPSLNLHRHLDERALTSDTGAALGTIDGAAGYDPEREPGEREHLEVRLRFAAGNPVMGQGHPSLAFDCRLLYQGAECDRSMVVLVDRR